MVPVGLFGLARNRIFVFGDTAPRIELTPAVMSVSGARIAAAPWARAETSYIEKACSVNSTSSPGPA